MTTFLPLIIVLGISMVKEAIEDFARYRADKALNVCLVSVYNPVTKAFQEKQWQHVQVHLAKHACKLHVFIGPEQACSRPLCRSTT